MSWKINKYIIVKLFLIYFFCKSEKMTTGQIINNNNNRIRTVDDLLEPLQDKHEIEIIYAVEAGSRAWGLSTDKSDYDLRFIYIYKNRAKYVCCNPSKTIVDVLSGKCEMGPKQYDWLGFDITKALYQANHMNASIVEWLWSPVVYISEYYFADSLRELIRIQDRVFPLLFHYRSLILNQRSHIYTVKKYLNNAIRPAAMLTLLTTINDFSRDNFFIEYNLIRVLQEIRPLLTSECYETIQELIQEKLDGKGGNIYTPSKPVEEWVYATIATEITPSKSKHTIDEYDELLRSFVFGSG